MGIPSCQHVNSKVSSLRAFYSTINLSDNLRPNALPQRCFGFITSVVKALPYNVFKMADLHIKFFQNIANSKRIYIFSKIKGIFVIISYFTCHLQDLRRNFANLYIEGIGTSSRVPKIAHLAIKFQLPIILHGS